MSTLIEEKKVKEWYEMLPENFCRAWEVSQVAEFKVQVFDEHKFWFGILNGITEHEAINYHPYLKYMCFVLPKIEFEAFNVNSREFYQKAKDRIEPAKKRVRVLDFHELHVQIRTDQACLGMIKKAFKVFDMSVVELWNVMLLSEGIRALDNTGERIRSHHLAEAIQYVTDIKSWISSELDEIKKNSMPWDKK